MPADSPTDRPLLGVTLMLGGMLVMPLMDGIAKLLAASYPVPEVVWARYFFHVAVLLPLVLWRHGARSLRLARPGLQLLRGGLLLVATGSFFVALARIPLAEALALAFVSPLIVTALSPWLLGERVGPRRWCAVVVGFAGVLVVLRPGMVPLDPGALLALLTGAVYALFSIITRRLAGSAPPLVTLAYTGLIGALVSSLGVPLVWVTPAAGDFALMVALGTLGAVGHFLVIAAYERAPASLLAPFGYAEIVGAVAIGWLFFGEFPDAWAWSGIAIIAASGIYIALRETRRRGS